MMKPFDIEEHLDDAYESFKSRHEAVVNGQSAVSQQLQSVSTTLIYIAAAIYVDFQINMVYFWNHVKFLSALLVVCYGVKLFILSQQEKLKKLLGEVFTDVFLTATTLVPVFFIYVLVALLRSYFQPGIHDLPYVALLAVFVLVLIKTFFHVTEVNTLPCKALKALPGSLPSVLRKSTS